jgi:hypothetical protein
MTMQYDVKAAHLNQSGQMVVGRTRVKGLLIGGAASGVATLWDSTSEQVTATYERAGYLVTVTKNSHGLTNGQLLGLSFAPAGATPGNYNITVINANSFSFTDINTGTIAASTACAYNTRWLLSFDATSTAASTMLIPGEGLLASNGVNVYLATIPAITVFYG